MLRFRQKKIIAVFVLLSLSLNSFAESGLKEKRSTNLVELFKVKAHATDHIKSIEARLLATDDAVQEELLVEYAQSLLYYQDRHNKTVDSKGTTSKGVSSLSANGTSGKASKVDRSKGPYSTNKIYRKALNAYKKASKLSLNKSRIKYTRELSELAVKLQNKEELVQVFDELLQHGGDESGTYLAHVDYADGLAKFKDDEAEVQFLSAVNLRSPSDGVEAYFMYANYLLKIDRLREALSILDKFTFDERSKYVHIIRLKQKIMHKLNLNTVEIDREIEKLRKSFIGSPFIGGIEKFKVKVNNVPSNSLNLSFAHAFTFSHNNVYDDSRGKYASDWLYTSEGDRFSLHLINAAEVIYNEARGDGNRSRIAVAWAIRNRALIGMNNCSNYPGGEGHPTVNICRLLLKNGPLIYNVDATEVYPRYSCVVHGGTVLVGSKHTQMNDAHVNIESLKASGVLWDISNVFHGWEPDPTGEEIFSLNVSFSNLERNVNTGNPNGAQEWRKQNYCAENHHCKSRLGNVGSDLPDPGNTCPYGDYSESEIFFWGQKPKYFQLHLLDE
ncbi:MAG: sel1 repeat family protein [Alteromonadaceae bacterium]|nr:sel1 repeat family protein [Alteromonadaceae bacterium]